MNQFGSKRFLQLFPEMCNELRPTIRNDDHLWNSMQTDNLVEIDLCILLGRISCMHRNKMSDLGVTP